MSTKFKNNNVWKDVSKQYIKVLGKWEEVKKDFIKVGNVWADSSNLSGTLIDYDMTIDKEADGSRYLVNSANPTTHKAPLHSGHSVTLSGDGKIEVPINYDSVAGTVQGSVTTFNETTKMFEQVTSLPLSTTYTLKDGTYGIICKLHTAQFTQADLDAFNARPELMIEWYFGTKAIPSGLVKSVDDKVYYPVDGHLMELSYSEGAEENKSNIFTNANDWQGTIGTGINHVEIANNKAKFYCDGVNIHIRSNPDVSLAIGKSYIAKIVISDYIEGRISLDYNNSSNLIPESVGNHLLIWEETINDKNILKRVKAITNLSVSKFSIKEILSEYLPIEGTYTISNISQYGVQSLLTKGDIVPTAIAKAGTIEGSSDGRYVELPLVDATKQKHLVTKCLSEIKGDITQVTEIPCTP